MSTLEMIQVPTPKECCPTNFSLVAMIADFGMAKQTLGSMVRASLPTGAHL